MKKINYCKIISNIVIFSLLTTSFSFAASENDLKKKQEEVDDKISQAKDDLHEVTANKTEALKAISSITEQINGFQDQIDELNDQIDELDVSITQSQKKLDSATKELDKQQNLLNERLVVLYEAGETSYLDVLLTSENLTDFISNYYLVSELASYDTELLEKIETEKQEIEKAKQQLEDSKSKVEIAKKNKQTKSNELKAAKTEKDKQVTKLSQEEKNIQNTLDQFEKDKRAIKNELAELAKKNSNVTPSAPSASGYIFPVLGLSKANINNKNYPSYAGHTGVDVNINASGKTIVAVKAGTVVKSLAYKNSSGYYSYGECIVIDHHDGTMTLYAHGAPGSRRVSTGDTVKQGQAIMTVGSTGNSSGPHLHFEVRIKGSPVNPLPYLP